MSEQTQTPNTDHEKRVAIFIDGHQVEAPRDDMTGAQIRHLVHPPIPEDRDLWLDLDGGLDKLIEDHDQVELREGMRFFTVPKVINPGTVA